MRALTVPKGAAMMAMAGLLVSGCQTTAPPSLPVAAAPTPSGVQAKPRPGPRRCVPRSFAGEPRYPDTDTALRNAGGAADRYQLIAAGRLLRIERLRTLERVVAGCR